MGKKKEEKAGGRSARSRADGRRRNRGTCRWKRFPTWKTIQLGTYKTPAVLIKAIKGEGSHISRWALQILQGIMLTTRPTRIKLVKVTGKQLGQTRMASFRWICALAKAHGLACCPIEVGPQFRKQYKKQPEGEMVNITMDLGGRPSVWHVDHDGDGRQLDVAVASSTCILCFSGDAWIFVAAPRD